MEKWLVRGLDTWGYQDECKWLWETNNAADRADV